MFGLAAAVVTWPLLDAFGRLGDTLIFFGFVLVAVVLGFFCSILFGWFIIGPWSYSRSLDNGEPFKKGDEVQILIGDHRDKIGYVHSTFDIGGYAGAHRIRVALEKGAKKEDLQTYCSLEILRLSPDRPTPEDY